MRKDFQIAILLALAAIPAGVALMAAPEYIAVLKEYPAPFFWGGLILASTLIVAAIIIAVRGEASEPRSGHERRMIALAGMIIFGLGFVTSAAVYFWPTESSTPDERSALARLAELGWSLHHQPNGMQFAVSGSGPLPSMRESAIYFAQLRKPFTLVFSGTNGIEGVHYLSDLANCKELSVAAGTFTDMTELRGFHHLSALYVTQTPINGLTTVDLSPLSSLTNLQRLNLFGTKVTTIRPLASLKNLNFLSLKDTLVTDLSPGASFESLEFLDITGTRISDLSALKENERLTELNIGGAQIGGLASLRGLKSLKNLW